LDANKAIPIIPTMLAENTAKRHISARIGTRCKNVHDFLADATFTVI
jgi:hypothetical protein